MAEPTTVVEQEQDEHMDITMSAPAIITLIVLSLMLLGAIIFFGYQTWLFVSWLLPQDNMTMKILGVVNFDVASYVWLATGLFLARWITNLTRTLAVIAGVVTFILSLSASVIQMSIADAERLGQNLNADYVHVAEGIIIIALVWNICTLLAIIHIQWPYISGYHPPKRQKSGKKWFSKKQQVQPVSLAQTATSPAITSEMLRDALLSMSHDDRDAFLEKYTAVLPETSSNGNGHSKNG